MDKKSNASRNNWKKRSPQQVSKMMSETAKKGWEKKTKQERFLIMQKRSLERWAKWRLARKEKGIV